MRLGNSARGAAADALLDDYVVIHFGSDTESCAALKVASTAA
jgi:hypothetical protein